MDLIERARNAAIIAHRGQERLNGLPYFVHPSHVAGLVNGVYPDMPSHVVAAAYLHDVTEDTDYDISDFPSEVLRIVDLLTNQFEGQPGAKLKDMERLRDAEDKVPRKWAIIVKLADRFDNFTDDGTFSKSYRNRRKVRQSTHMLLDMAKEDSLDTLSLWDKVDRLVREADEYESRSSKVPEDLNLFESQILELDMALTGKDEHACRHNLGNRRFPDPAEWAVDSELAYLSDGGYSRVFFKDEVKLCLDSVSTSEAKRLWKTKSIKALRESIEDTIRQAIKEKGWT